MNSKSFKVFQIKSKILTGVTEIFLVPDKRVDSLLHPGAEMGFKVAQKDTWEDAMNWIFLEANSEPYLVYSLNSGKVIHKGNTPIKEYLTFVFETEMKRTVLSIDKVSRTVYWIRTEGRGFTMKLEGDTWLIDTYQVG